MYGENTAALRAHLSELLRQHRIQQRIGGMSAHTVPETTTIPEREQLGQLIQNYRYGVLTWCLQVVNAATPTLLGYSADRTATPDAELRRRLTRTINGSTARLPSMVELTTPQEFPLVEGWRQAAKAAALGEHDLGGEAGRGSLDRSQCLTVVKDAAEIVRGLLVLDRRYGRIPGWEPLRGSIRLQRAAEGCAFITAADYTVDLRGWRPPARAIAGPPRPGFAGVVQAEHNLLVHLRAFPNALNFKRIVDSQRLISNLVARRFAADAPELTAWWTQRGGLYTKIQDRARNLGGLVGAGGVAAAEAANALTRLRNIPDDAAVSQQALRDLNTLFTAVDQRMSEIFEEGSQKRLYVARTRVPHIVSNDDETPRRVLRERFVPITSATQSELVQLVRDDLRPRPRQPEPPARAHENRVELSQAITHRAGRRGPGAPHPPQRPEPEPPITL